jgi:hypothetical protein
VPRSDGPVPSPSISDVPAVGSSPGLLRGYLESVWHDLFPRTHIIHHPTPTFWYPDPTDVPNIVHASGSPETRRRHWRHTVTRSPSAADRTASSPRSSASLTNDASATSTVHPFNPASASNVALSFGPPADANASLGDLVRLCLEPAVTIVNLEVLLSLSDRGLVRSTFGPGCEAAPAGSNGTATQLCGALGAAARACQGAGKKVFVSLLAKSQGGGLVDSVGQPLFANASAAALLAREFRGAVLGPLFGGAFVPDGVGLEVIPDTAAPFRRRSPVAPPSGGVSDRSGLAVFLGMVRDIMRAGAREFYVAASVPCEDPYVLPEEAMDAIDFVTVRFNDPSCNIGAFSIGRFFSTWKALGGSSASASRSLVESRSVSETRLKSETRRHRTPSMQLDIPLPTGSLPEPTSTITLTSTHTITRTAFVTASSPYFPSPATTSSDLREAAPRSSSSDITSTEILIVSVIDISNPSSATSGGATSIAIPSVLPGGLGEAEFVSAISSFLAAQSRTSLPSQASVIDIKGAGSFTVNLVKRTASGSRSMDLSLPTDIPPIPLPSGRNPSQTFFQITVLSTPTATPVPLLEPASPFGAPRSSSPHGPHPPPHEFWPPSNATSPSHAHHSHHSSSVTPQPHGQHTAHGNSGSHQPRLLIGVPGVQAANASALPALISELRGFAAENGFGGVAVLGSYPAMEASGAWGALVGVLAAVFGSA